LAFQLPFRFSTAPAPAPLDSPPRLSKMMENDQPQVRVVLILMLMGMV
jgi:hypothetical protein